MPRGIDQVELVGLAFVLVVKGNRVHPNSNAPLPFEVHPVEQLGPKFALGNGPRFQKKLVRKGAFAMVYMGNNRKIADQVIGYHEALAVLQNIPKDQPDASSGPT